jgi:HD-GYP domain-containing protein (c-di-GMP phosphodiesterase class II)/DNA-binding CsgD family transcriptional regulator
MADRCQRHAMTEDAVDLLDALRALAFMGDLRRGQPGDHPPRVAGLAPRLGQRLGLDGESLDELTSVALLRWSGCTANAGDVAATVADDVEGRAAMLALQPERVHLLVAPADLPARVRAISAIHCEVSAMIAEAIGLAPSVAAALACVFEHWDGSGQPRGVRDAIPQAALIVSLCSDLEVLTRVHGLAAACALLRARADRVYPSALVDIACELAPVWFEQLALGAQLEAAPAFAVRRMAPLALVGDVIDLKLPWLLGHSRAVSACADTLARAIGLPPALRDAVRRAGWLQGLGRAAIPNAIWEREGALSNADWERVRLNPYWTARAARHIGRLAQEVDIASNACERLDGSGYFRAARRPALPLEQRVLPVAASWVALRSRRPWRCAFSDAAALDILRAEAARGRLDGDVVAALASSLTGRASVVSVSVSISGDGGAVLTARELDVLRRVSLGDSNKAAGQALGISPSTVRTHLESVFRKLGCNSRAACTLKAALSGLL